MHFYTPSKKFKRSALNVAVGLALASTMGVVGIPEADAKIAATHIKLSQRLIYTFNLSNKSR